MFKAPRATAAGKDRMSAKDHLLWRLETETDVRPHIVLLFVLEGEADEQELLLWHEHAVALLPHMGCRVVIPRTPFRRPLWKTDSHFNPARHLRRIGCPGKGSHKDLLTLAEGLAEIPFLEGLPPWRSYLIEGLEEGRTAYLLKVSHAIADGLRLRELFLAQAPGARPMLNVRSAASADPDPAKGPRTALTTTPGTSRLRRTTTLLRFLVGMARDMADLPPGGPRGTIEKAGDRFLTIDLSLPALKAAARSAGGTVLDSLVAGLTEGCRLYNEHHQVHRRVLRVMSPYGRAPLNGHHASRMGNHWFIVRFHVPADRTDAPERIRAVRTALRKVYNRDAVDWMGAVTKVAQLLPAGVLRGVFERFIVSHDLIVSNIPGPPTALTIAGTPVAQVYGVAPRMRGPVCATMVTCETTCYITLNVDPVFIRDVELFGDCVRRGLEQVTSSALQ